MSGGDFCSECGKHEDGHAMVSECIYNDLKKENEKLKEALRGFIVHCLNCGMSENSIATLFGLEKIRESLEEVE